MSSILDALLHLPDGRDPSTITFVDSEAGFAKRFDLPFFFRDINYGQMASFVNAVNIRSRWETPAAVCLYCFLYLFNLLIESKLITCLLKHIRP